MGKGNTKVTRTLRGFHEKVKAQVIATKTDRDGPDVMIHGGSLARTPHLRLPKWTRRLKALARMTKERKSAMAKRRTTEITEARSRRRIRVIGGRRRRTGAPGTGIGTGSEIETETETESGWTKMTGLAAARDTVGGSVR